MSDYGDSSVSPPQAQYESDVLSWASEAISEGEAFLRAQPGFDKIDPTIRAIMSAEQPESSMVPGPLSRADIHQLGKIALDLRSGLTDTKVFWEYSTKNRHFEQSAQMATRLGRAWWLGRQCDQRLADAISWCFAAGSGPLRLVYNKEIGDLEMQAWDPRDVLPVRINDYLDYDSGFAVILRKENTVNYLRSRYGYNSDGTRNAKYDRIRADRDGAFARLGSGSLMDKIASVASPILKGIFQERSKTQLKVPSCDTYTTQVKDDSVNTTGQTVLMGPHDRDGKPLAPWCYAVEPKEALYPRGRVIVATKSCVLYDGPSIYWWQGFDVMKLSLDHWPFSFLGKSPMWDLLPLQDSLRDMFRLMNNTVKKIQRPGVIADKNSVSKAMWEKLDTSLAGLKAMQNPSMGKGIQVLETKPAIMNALLPCMQFVIERMEFISGAKDVTNFAKLGQIPASETIERIMEAMSPAIRSRSRTMEAFMRPLAYKVLAGFMEFYSQAKRMRVLGKDGAVLDDLDYDPGTLIPAYMHPEDLDASTGLPTAEAQKRGVRSRYERAQFFLPQFDFVIQPGSLLAASEVTQKLLYLQLARAGMLDMFTLLERLGIPNVGAPGDLPASIVGRLQYQNQNNLGPNVSSAGRKASGQEMPQMNSSGKISESG